MRKVTKLLSLLMVLGVLAASVFAQNAQNFAPGSFSGWSDVQQFNQWTAHSINAVTATAASMSLDTCYYPLSNGPAYWFPLAAGESVKIIDSAGNSETVSVTSVSTPVPSVGAAQPGYACSFVATFANAHSAGIRIQSADGGLGEAVTTLKPTGGTVVVTSGSGITAATILALGLGATNVGVVDISGSNAVAPVGYAYNGTGYIAVSTPQATVNGASLVPFVSDINVTLSTGATTTAVGTASFVPANAFIIGVTGRVTTTITSACTGWSVGDTTTAARFIANNTGLTAGTKATNTTGFNTTAIASATTGTWQATAEALQITCAGGNPGAGAVRVTVFGFTVTPSAQ